MPRAAKPQANRTDLLTPGPTPGPAPGQGQPNGQPIQVPTNLPYGENQQLQQAQAAVPLPQAPGLDMASALQAAKNFSKPALPGLTGPTARPNEPVTAGLPGASFPATGQRQVGNLSSMISAVAQSANSPALSQLAARAASAGQ